MTEEMKQACSEETERELWTDPDWDCPRCLSVNRAIRDRCRICTWDSALVSEGVMCL